MNKKEIEGILRRLEIIKEIVNTNINVFKEIAQFLNKDAEQLKEQLEKLIDESQELSNQAEE